MIVPQFFIQAATASIAVKACFLADSAEPALFAMIHIILLCVVIVQAADIAEVGREVLLTLDARLGLYLFRVAAEALDMGDIVPLHLMVLPDVTLVVIALFIVTYPTVPESALANWIRALEHARPSIVPAAELSRL